MIIRGRTMLSTVEIEICRDKKSWIISVVAYGEWKTRIFKNYQECISYIESYILISDLEKSKIRDMEEKNETLEV